ncbi:TPA: ABC transporter permease, partial [Clostridioides difficile]|nr:ABC transporter permease [Clostridioides difficile]
MSLVKELYRNRDLILNLSKNDFKTKYAGSYLGIFWAFVQPVVIVLIYWFVFQ